MVPGLGCARGSRLQGLVPVSASWSLTPDTLYLPGIHEARSGPFSQTSPPSRSLVPGAQSGYPSQRAWSWHQAGDTAGVPQSHKVLEVGGHPPTEPKRQLSLKLRPR